MYHTCGTARFCVRSEDICSSLLTGSDATCLFLQVILSCKRGRRHLGRIPHLLVQKLANQCTSDSPFSASCFGTVRGKGLEATKFSAGRRPILAAAARRCHTAGKPLTHQAKRGRTKPPTQTSFQTVQQSSQHYIKTPCENYP